MKKVVIVGGGFFGMYLAEHAAKKGCSVTLVEKSDDFMLRASYVNQARVHNGYHYPRSVLTALRSRVSFPRFVAEFGDCVDKSFEKYYLVGKLLSKVTAKQFEKFCHRIGAPCEPAPYKITRLTNPNLVEACFSTTEYAFDAVILKNIMKQRLDEAGVDIRMQTIAGRVWSEKDALRVSIENAKTSEPIETLEADHVFNCTYSMINFLLAQSGLELIPLKHEMTEMCLVEVPDEIKHVGITVMCGPFFSVMPFPAVGLHSFSHVRYTPHYEWHDTTADDYMNAHRHFDSVEKKTSWRAMQLDASRYIPLLRECQYQRSIFEVKTILPRSEADDSRPILFKPNYGLRGFHCIMGGKIDNIYDAVDEIEKSGMFES